MDGDPAMAQRGPGVQRMYWNRAGRGGAHGGWGLRGPWVQARGRGTHFQLVDWGQILGVPVCPPHNSQGATAGKTKGPLGVAAHVRHLCSHRVTAPSVRMDMSIPGGNWGNQRTHQERDHFLKLNGPVNSHN